MAVRSDPCGPSAVPALPDWASDKTPGAVISTARTGEPSLGRHCSPSSISASSIWSLLERILE